MQAMSAGEARAMFDRLVDNAVVAVRRGMDETSIEHSAVLDPDYSWTATYRLTEQMHTVASCGYVAGMLATALNRLAELTPNH